MKIVMNTIRIDISHDVCGCGGWFSGGVGATDTQGHETDTPCLPQGLTGEGPHGPGGFDETVDHVLAEVKDLLRRIYEHDELCDESVRREAYDLLPGYEQA